MKISLTSYQKQLAQVKAYMCPMNNFRACQVCWIKNWTVFKILMFCLFDLLIVLFQHYHYSVCVSNKKIHVSKIRHDPNTLESDEVRVITESSW